MKQSLLLQWLLIIGNKNAMILPVDWPDTSLGVPEPGKVYAQVIIPGYRIILSAKEKSYTYHAGELGGKMTVIAAPQ